MTRREMALCLALAVVGCWLLWAGRQEGGPRTVLTTAGLWWWAALQATWRVWVPAIVVVGGLVAAIPPRVPRRPQLRLVRAAAEPAPVPTIAPAPGAPVATVERELTQDPTQDPSQTVTHGSTHGPVRTVWEAFAPLRQEGDDGAAS
jgi:hypothetical protein